MPRSQWRRPPSQPFSSQVFRRNGYDAGGWRKPKRVTEWNRNTAVKRSWNGRLGAGGQHDLPESPRRHGIDRSSRSNWTHSGRALQQRLGARIASLEPGQAGGRAVVHWAARSTAARNLRHIRRRPRTELDIHHSVLVELHFGSASDHI
jgi:hypothetical protein